MPRRVESWYKCENCLWWLEERTHCHKNPQTIMKKANDYCAGFKDYTGALDVKEEKPHGNDQGT